MNIELVHPTARNGAECIIGRYTIIEKDCCVGDGCRIGDYCKLMPGSVLGDNVIFDDYSNSSGAVLIGNGVMVKRMSCITQGTIIEDLAFIGPGIMIIHESAVSWQRATTVSRGVHIRSGAIIGGRATLLAGVTIGRDAVVGAGAVVTHDCDDNGIYIGAPARKVGEVPEERRISIEMELRFDTHSQREYLPDMTGCGTIDF